jgi:hypothetical protein
MNSVLLVVPVPPPVRLRDTHLELDTAVTVLFL